MLDHSEFSQLYNESSKAQRKIDKDFKWECRLDSESDARLIEVLRAYQLPSISKMYLFNVPVYSESLQDFLR